MQMFGMELEIKDFWGKRKYLLFPILASVIMLISFLMVFLPQLIIVSELRDDLELETKRLERLTQKSLALAGLNEAEINSLLEVVERVLPSQKPVFTLLASLQQLSGVTNVAVSQFDFSPGSLATESATTSKKSTPKAGRLESFPLSLTVAGGVEEINNFLQGLDTTAPLMEVVDVKLQVGKGGGPSEGVVQLVVHYSQPPKEIGKISDPLPPNLAEKYGSLVAQLINFLSGERTIVSGSPRGKKDLFGF